MMPLAPFLFAAVVLTAAAGPAKATLDDQAVAEHSRNLIFGHGDDVENALAALVARGNADVAPTLALAMRYRQGEEGPLLGAFARLTGVAVDDWTGAFLWQEAHPEVVPHESFREIKLAVLAYIDENFMRFLGGEKSLRRNMDIRLEEIAWGGVRVDGIPSLDRPAMIAAADASYLNDDDLVFGVEIDGDSRAYPLRIMGWHEMFNDVIGGVPVALAYCTLCGSGILFETRVPPRAEPFVFGSSGLLYRSNKLMFDRQTDSLWNQFTGRPVSGPLRGTGIELKIRPVAITSWRRWRAQNPNTTVLSLETGYPRDYGAGVVYRDYFASPDLMFPTVVRDERRVRRKDYVFGIREAGAAKAWPLEAFRGGAVINDRLGGSTVVLIGDAETRTVRAYYRGDHRFEAGRRADRLKAADGGEWVVEEAFLAAPDGSRLARAPGHVSYWFAWDGYLGARSELYDPAAGR